MPPPPPHPPSAFMYRARPLFLSSRYSRFPACTISVSALSHAPSFLYPPLLLLLPACVPFCCDFAPFRLLPFPLSQTFPAQMSLSSTHGARPPCSCLPAMLRYASANRWRLNSGPSLPIVRLGKRSRLTQTRNIRGHSTVISTPHDEEYVEQPVHPKPASLGGPASWSFTPTCSANSVGMDFLF